MKFIVLLACLGYVAGFTFQSTNLHSSKHILHASQLTNLPEEIAKVQAANEFVIVERLPEPLKLDSGLFLPNKQYPAMKLCRVLSVGEGFYSKAGVMTPSEGLKPGDLIWSRNPWGIGPKDEEVGARKFSYMRFADVCGRFDASEELQEEVAQIWKDQEVVDALEKDSVSTSPGGFQSPGLGLV
eukprot:CAMPEP_0113933976 /NCGR_PEP_ID=MMETSP1339-20121228/1332_1 /TAXON_ID=94617 /ORGANISM="Fibrocapsa japonica" /LENGTH=183 /DNA_ID=CAMNT_0000935571 /DNA_START=73 /DNA_END=624 /DNA_ORIENTATION=+ /assembly_acc=CAM_ASM_000762